MDFKQNKENINKEIKRAYDAKRYAIRKSLRPPKTWKSKYRFINDGNGSGKLVHQAIVEKVLGRSLPFGVEIHHVDGDGHNNANSNLVVCPDHAYHALLHLRTRALEACGNPNWLRCIRCKKWDDPKNMSSYIPKDQTTPRAEHRECNNEYRRNRNRMGGNELRG